MTKRYIPGRSTPFESMYSIRMLRASIFVTLFALCAVGLVAQDDLAQYQTWMKAAAGASQASRGAVAAKDSAAITTQAKIMEDNFEHISEFWAKKQKEDAVKMADAAKDAAKTLAAATTPEDQAAAMQKINGTCRNCHTTYRDGSKFKQ
ncbi:MAG: hypothetical protein ABJC09_06995 [Terriglobia bacterium]